MTTTALSDLIFKKKTFLSVGLDVDLEKIPKHLLELEDPIFEFNKAIIDATHQYAVAYKPNTAFYEAYGLKGWRALEKTMAYLNAKHPEIYTIADAKRGDIGNTSTMYAKAFFEHMNFDAITVAPYMGKDSVEPFLEFENRHTILLGLTSNVGASDFQYIKDASGKSLYKTVIETSQTWSNSQNLMYVVGATKPESFKEIRELVPDSFLLVPGVGAQGGTVAEVCKYGMTADCGLLINSSRSIIYASSDKDFVEKTALAAKDLAEQMAKEIDGLQTKKR